MKIGLISSKKLPQLLTTEETVTVETPYGSVPVEISKVKNHTVFFMNRHGSDANLPPHTINYRALIDALAVSHVEYILAVNTVGSLQKNIRPGEIVIPHDFIDFTKSRSYTFFDEKRVHVDMTDPFCPTLRQHLIDEAKKIVSKQVHEKGVYLATEGPRLETVSEIRYFAQFADIVGMTGVPEVVLAREKALCYASLGLVCNMAAGLQATVSADDITHVYKKQEATIAKILGKVIESLSDTKHCLCQQVVAKAGL